MAAATAHVLPDASEIRDGRLLIGGCDAEALAREHGTPAYVLAEDDLRSRARAFTTALAAHHDGPGEVVFASKALPCTPVLRLFAEEGLGCDVASGGELHLALHAGFAPGRIYLHGNAKSREELRMALDAGVGTIVLDNAEEALRLSELLGGRAQRVLLRVDPRRRRGHPRGDPHGAGRLEVRLRARRCPRADRRPARGPRDRGPAHAPGLAAVRARALPARDPGARLARRLRDLRPRRRARRALHGRRRADGRRDLGRRDGRGRARRARPAPAARSCSSRAARSWPTRA